MSPLRVIKCPKCGVRHYIGHPCNQSRNEQPDQGSILNRIIFSALICVLATALIVALSMLLAESKGDGYGVALAFGCFLIMHLLRLGHEWDDGIDFWTLMLPAPFDWGEKFIRLINFWGMPRPYFRALYLASVVSFVIVSIVLVGNRGLR